MLRSGDVVRVDLGVPSGREAGFAHPAIVVTAQRILDADPTVVHVVPLTSTLRPFDSEVTIGADPTSGLAVDTAAQCQHLRAVATSRITGVAGQVGPAALAQVREVLAVLLDIPT